MPITYSKPDQNLSFAIPDEGEVFGVTGGTGQTYYRRVGNAIEQFNLVNSLLNEQERNSYSNLGEQVRAANARAREMGINLEAQQYNYGDIMSTGLFQAGGNGGPTRTYTGDASSFFNQRAGLPAAQQTLTRGTPTINPYGQGALTDQFGNVVQQQTQYTPAQAQANAIAQNSGGSFMNPDVGGRVAGSNAVIGPDGSVTYQGPIGGYLNEAVQAFTGLGANQTQAQALAQNLAQTQSSSYSGPSIVDYLSSIGQPSDFASRAKLAQQYGIENYQGSGPQNTELLRILRAQGTPQVPGVAMSGATGGSPVPQFAIPPTVPSQALGSGNSTSSFMNRVNAFFDTFTKYQTDIQKVQDQINAQNTQALQQQVGIEGQTISTPLIGGQLQNLKENVAYKLMPLQNQLESLVNAQGNAKDALGLALQLQAATKPDVLSTQVNKDTGDVTAFVQDINGNISSQKIGNVGVEKGKEYVSTGTYVNGSGQNVFFGVGADGKITQQVLGTAKAASSSSDKDESLVLRGIIDGDINGNELTPSDRVVAKAKLGELGFNSSTVPPWFADSIKQQNPGLIGPVNTQGMWNDYRLERLESFNKESDISFDSIPS